MLVLSNAGNSGRLRLVVVGAVCVLLWCARAFNAAVAEAAEVKDNDNGGKTADQDRNRNESDHE